MRDDDFGRPELMTPFSLSLAAEQAIENAKIKLDEMDTRLFRARSSIALVKARRQRATTESLADSGDASDSLSKSVGRETPLRSTRDYRNQVDEDRHDEARELQRLHLDIRQAHERARTLPAITEALHLAPPRPSRPDSAQMPDFLADLAREYREGFNLELQGTISFAELERAAATASEQQEPPLTAGASTFTSDVASPTLGQFVLDGEEREPGPESERWRMESMPENLLQPFSVSVGQYRRQDVRPPPPVPASVLSSTLWHRDAKQTQMQATKIPSLPPATKSSPPQATTVKPVLALPFEEERPFSPRPYSAGSLIPSLLPTNTQSPVAPSTPQRPTRIRIPSTQLMASPHSVGHDWIDPTPASPSQPATAKLASPATATLKRVQSGTRSRIVSPVAGIDWSASTSRSQRLPDEGMRPRRLQFSPNQATAPATETPVSARSAVSGIPRRATSVAARAGAIATAAAVTAMSRSTATATAPSSSPVGSPTTHRRLALSGGPQQTQQTSPSSSSQSATSPLVRRATQETESPQTRLLRERFERALAQLDRPVSASGAGPALQAHVVHSTRRTVDQGDGQDQRSGEGEGDSVAAQKLEAALRILEE